MQKRLESMQKRLDSCRRGWTAAEEAEQRAKNCRLIPNAPRTLLLPVENNRRLIPNNPIRRKNISIKNVYGVILCILMANMLKLRPFMEIGFVKVSKLPFLLEKVLFP
jgi:hypothetical protein